MLVIHHLETSQWERILWLCEELGVPYEMKRHERDAVTRWSPPELQALHPMGTAPVITDGDLVLAESGAIVDYIIAKHGGGRLALKVDHPDFAQYLYWFHFANATFVFSLTTMRIFMPVDLGPYPNIRADLRRMGERRAYKRAMEKGDPGLKPLLA